MKFKYSLYLLVKNSFILLALVFLLTTRSYSQSVESPLPDSLIHYAEKVLDTIQKHSMYVSEDNFVQIKKEFYENVKTAQTKYKLFHEFGRIFVKMGDYHGGFYFNNRKYGIPSQDIKVSDDLATGWSYGANIRTQIFDGKYGYLFLPPMIATSKKSRDYLAQQIQDSICHINQRGVEGWIIDLRVNNGGDMWAMLGGLTDLLGERKLGSYLEADGNQSFWEIKGQNLYSSDIKMTDLNSKCEIDQPIKIVALISVVTSSSAEAVALSINELPNSTLIGESTSGYTTANREFVIDEETSIILATAYLANIAGEYSVSIKPGIEVIQGDNFNDLDKDLKIQKAIEWLDSIDLNKSKKE